MSIDFENGEKYALGYYLHHAFIALTETLNQELRRVGLRLTHPQFTIIQTIFRYPGINQRELARATAKDTAAITRSLAYLEKEGWLERKRLNGCAKGVFVTDKARELQPLLERAIRQTLDRACSGTEDAEIENVNNFLRQMISTLSANKQVF